MKALFYTLLIFGGCFLAYDFFITPKSERLFFEREISPIVIPRASPSAPLISKEKNLGSNPSKAGEFVPPAFESLNTLTKNWTAIPASAFPRSVKLVREVEFKMKAGSSRMPAGSVVKALGCENGVVTLSPTESSSARGQMRVEDTDLKTQFVEPYQKWIAWRTEILRQQWEKSQKAKSQQALANVPAGAVDESGKPVRSGDGSYPVLLASMNAGDVTDITMKKVKRMGAPQLVTAEGRPTWVIDVHYDTIVFCGPMEAHAQAHIRDGKVIRWVYPGSGEPVP